MKDLKKAIVADQAEIKELRTNAQALAQAKTQLISSQNEVKRLKNGFQSLDDKHKADLRDYNSKLVHQESSLASESRRRETLEQQLLCIKSEAEKETKKAMERIRSLQEKVDALTQSFVEAQTSATNERQHLINSRATLVYTAQAYSHLAASSVSLEVHRQSEVQCASLRLRVIRLERRLADREALVEQLTDFCRQASEAKVFLARQLQELENDQQSLLRAHYLEDNTHLEDTALICDLFDACYCANQQHDMVVQKDIDFTQAIGCFYQEQFNDLLVAYAVAHRETVAQCAVVEQLVRHCTAVETEANVLRLDHRTGEAEFSRKSIEVAETLAQRQALNRQLEIHRQRIRKLEDTLEKDRQANDRLAQASLQSRQNEEQLRLEVDESVARQNMLMYLLTGH